MPAGNSTAVQRRSQKTMNLNKSGTRRALMVYATKGRRRKRIEKHYLTNPNDRSAQSALRRMQNDGY